MVTTVKKVLGVFAVVFKCALIYAVLITTAVLLQNSAYYLTPLLIGVLEKLGMKTSPNDEGAYHFGFCYTTVQKEVMFAHSLTTIIVAVQLALLITLALLVAARFGIGLTVEMNPVKMGWYNKEGEEAESLKKEHESTG
ncbi:MAG: hypothetical protein Q9224_006638 [Gallowayella concinna]